MDKRFEEIIDLAIQREEEAYNFYINICNTIKDSVAKYAVELIAGEEKKHKEFLVGYRKGNYGADSLRMSNVIDYKIAEYLEEPVITKDTTAQDVYLIASHREARSYEFYKKLAGFHFRSETEDMLLKMANEELKHKEKMEYLYSNTAFPQTSGG